MWVTAFFTNGGTPELGLSATVRIRKLSDDSLVVTDAAMSEVGDGHYKYDFTAYDENINYAIRCDGSATLSGAERYTYGGNENSCTSTTVASAVWDALKASHVVVDSFGEWFTNVILYSHGDPARSWQRHIRNKTY